jgi:hypothetical protein
VGIFARGLRLVASLSSAAGAVVARDTYEPSGPPKPRDTARVARRLAALTALARDPSGAHDGLSRAAALMAELFEEAGLVVTRDRFAVDGLPAENVLGKIGGEDGLPILVLGHYDAIPGTPGADDNASGAVGLVEIAERLRGRPLPRPVWFVATTHEECGMHGSVRLAQARRAQGGVAAVIDLEMIAYTARSQALPRGVSARRRGDFVAVVANEPSAFIGRALVGAARRTSLDLPVELIVLAGRGTDLPISRLSDHAPFWDANLPAVMVTDTAFLKNPHYHAPTDTLATLDLAFMLRVCELCAEALIDLDGSG